MSNRILFALFLLFVLVLASCDNADDNSASDFDKASPEAIASSAVSPVSSTSSLAEKPSPNFDYEKKDGKIVLTEKSHGFRISFPSEFHRVMNCGGEGGDVYLYIRFEFSKEPFNEQYTELCSSLVSIHLDKNYPFDPDKDERPRTVMKADDGSDLYIIDKYQTSYVVGFSFARADIPCGGVLELEKSFYEKHETELLDMLKSITTDGNK